MKLLPDHINHYIETLSKLGLSDATIERKTSSLKKFSQWAKDKGYLENPSEGAQVGANQITNNQTEQRVATEKVPVERPKPENLLPNTLIQTTGGTSANRGQTEPIGDIKGEDVGRETRSPGPATRQDQQQDTIVIRASAKPLSDIVPAVDDPQKKKKRLYAALLAAGGAALVLALLLLNRQFPVFRLFENFAKTEPALTIVPTVAPSNTSQNNKIEQNNVPTVAAAAGPWTVFFKGKVTGLPGTRSDSGSLQFSLYEEPTGGSPLWTSKAWQLTPNEKGEFIAKLGDAAQQDTLIPQDLFFKHEYLYLGVRVDQGEESTPRFRVSSAAHAADAAALQGHEPSETAAAGQIPVIDQTGALVLGSATPSLIAKSGTFKIQGQAITLATPAFSNGNITLAPDGEGKINLNLNGSTGNQISARDANLTTGSLFYGYVGNDNKNYNLIELASGSTPTTKFSVDALGNTYIAGTLTMGRLAVARLSSGSTSPIQFDSSILFPTHATVSATGDFTLDPSGVLNITAKIQNPGTRNNGRVYIEDTTQIAGHLYTRGIDAEGTVQLNGTTYIRDGLGIARPTTALTDGFKLDVVGNATVSGDLRAGGQIQTGRFASAPSAVGPGSLYYNSGDTTLYVYNGTSWIAVAGGATSGFWQRNSGVLSPYTIADDFTVGGISTASAKFQVVSGSGNVSTSGTVTLPNSNTLTGASNYLQLSQGVSVGGGTTYYVNSSGTANLNAGTFAGLITANGGLTVASGQNLTVSGNVASNLIPSVTSTDNLGSATNFWNNLYVNNIYGASSGVSGYWQRNGGALSPAYLSDDLLVGSTATASALFQIFGNTGNATTSGNLTFHANPVIATTAKQSLTLGDSSTGNIQLFSSANYIDSSGNLVLAGNANVNGNTTLGDATGDTITFTGRAASSLLPTTNNSYNLGSDALRFAGIYGQTVYQAGNQVCDITGNCTAATDVWSEANGALFPKNTTVDLLVGATGTSSAKFAFMNVNSGTPTASVSAGAAGATYLTATGTLATTAKQSLTLGNATTGNIIFGNNIASNFIPSSTSTYDLGSSSNYWNNLYANNIYAPATGVSGYWQRNLGALAPTNITDDFLVGGTATSSALFQVLGNTGTATTAGNLVFSGSAPTITTTKMAPLTIGSATTGPIQLSPKGTTGLFVDGTGNVGIGTTSPGAKLESVNTSAAALTETLRLTNNGAGAGTGMYLSFANGGTVQGLIKGYYDGEWKMGLIAGPSGDLMTLTRSGNVGIGTTSPLAKLDVRGAASVSGGLVFTTTPTISSTAMQALTIGDSSTGQIQFFSASNAINSSGNLTLAGTITLPNSNTITGVASYVNHSGGIGVGATTGAPTYYINNLGTANLNAITAAGLITANGGVTVAGAQSLTVTGNVASNLIPSADNTYDLGASGTRWKNIYGVTLYQAGNQVCDITGNCSAATDIWSQANGALFPKNATVDLLVGGTATSSAKFALLNVSSGTPTASVSAGNAGAASLTATGTLATTAKQSLTLGDSNTGNIQFYSASNSLTSGGNLTLAGTIALPNSNTLTGVASYVNVSNGIGVGATTGAPTYYVNNLGTANLNAITAAGLITANGGVTVASGQNLTVSGNVASHLIPSATTTYDLGSTTRYWQNGYIQNLYVSGNYNGFWQRFNGALSPTNITDDLLVGATATPSSATANYFQVIGTGSTAGDASSSGILTLGTNRTAGIIETEKMLPLTIGSSTTGPIQLSPKGTTGLFVDGTGNVGIGTTGPTNLLHLYGSASAGSKYALIQTANTAAEVGLLLQNTQNTWQLYRKPNDTSLYVYGPTVGDAMTFQTSGNVGIGTTAPGQILDIKATAPHINLNGTGGTAYLDLQSNGTTKWQQGMDNNFGTAGYFIYDNANSKYAFGINAATGNVVLQPTAGNVGIGTTSPLEKLDVSGNATVSGNLTFSGAASTIANRKMQPIQIGDSATGNINFYGTSNSLTSAGNLTLAGTVTFPNSNTLTGVSNYTQFSNGVSVGGASTYYINNVGTANLNAITAAGLITANGGVTVAGAQSLTVTGNVASNLIPSADNTYDLGASGTRWKNIYGVTLYQAGNSVCDISGNCSAATDIWSQANGALFPKNGTVDLLVGGTATSSAKFALLNVSSGTPTASVSAGNAGAASLTATGTLATTAKQSLTLGDSNTGNIQFYSASNSLTSGGNLTLAGTIALPNSNTITGVSSYVNVSNGIGVGATTGAPTYYINNLGTANLNAITAAGLITANGGVTVASGQNLTVSGNVASNLIPSATTTYDLGSTTRYWQNAYLQNLYVSGNYNGFWQRFNGALSPTNITDDLLVGATATPSASTTNYFQVLGTGSTQGDASSSGNLVLGTNRTTATIATQRMIPLTLGSSTTGPIQLSPKGTTGLFVDATGQVGVGTTVPIRNLQVQASGTSYITVGTTNNTESQMGFNGTNMLLQTAGYSNGILFNGGAMYIGSTSTGSVGIGNTTPLEKLDVTGNATVSGNLTFSGAASTIANRKMQPIQIGDSATGNINFYGTSNSLTSGGNLTLAGTITLPNSNTITGVTNYTQVSGGVSVGGGTTYYVNSSGTANLNAITAAGLITANGGVTVAGGQSLTVSGNVASNVIPSADNTYDLGASGTRWKNIYGVTLYQAGNQVCDVTGNCSAATDIWSQANGALFPKNGTVDLLVGGTATSSAKFALLNVSSGTPTASVSAGNAGATSLTATGTLATTAKQTLTLGDTNTGNINFYSPSNVLTSGGNLTLAGTISLPNSNTVTGVSSYVNVSNGIGVGATTGAPTYYINSSGTANLNAITAAGLITANGGVTVASGQNLTVSGNVASNLIPSATTTYDLGSTTRYWQNGYIQNLYVSGNYNGFWQRFNGALSPTNITDDLLVGATATPSSATANYFQVFGTGTTQGDASSSGVLTLGTNRTTATIGTQRMIPLTIGSSTTGPIQLSPKGTTGLFVDGTGQVGIGTTSPETKLNISGGNLRLSSGQQYQWGTGTVTEYVTGSQGSNFISFTTSGNEAVRINTSGLVGIGTTTPLAKLDVNGTASVSGAFTLYGTPTIQSTANQSLTLGGNTTGNIFLQPLNGNGFVGVGTSSPISLLHVAGQCVTGDTKLRRKRRRKSKSQNPNSKDDPPCVKCGYAGTCDECYSFEDVRIDQIEEGDEIMTLDETTGVFVPQVVEKLMDMGIKTTFKITTEDGKSIRTTATHPYLVHNEDTSALVPAFEDQSSGNHHQNPCDNSQIGICTADHTFSLSPQKEEPEQNQYSTRDTRGEQVRIHDIPFNHTFTPFTKNSAPAEQNNAIIMDTVKVNKKSNTVWGRTNNGEMTPAENHATETLPSISDARSRWPTESLLIDHTVAQTPAPVNGTWKTVRQLKPGMKIAVFGDHGVLDWQTITSIDRVGEEQVYDVQIANTHNFVANGIVAHNTYITGAKAGQALTILNETGDQAIFTASASGTPVFTIGRTGILSLNQNSQLNTTGTLLLNSTGTLSVNTTNNQAITTGTGNTTLGGNLLLNNSASTTTFGGIAYTWPTSGQANNYVLATNGSGTLSWNDPNTLTGGSFWSQAAGALFPKNSTVDVLIGATATTSAKFAFLNVATGTPTASVSGNLTLDAAGVIATTKMQQLTLGSSTTGPIQLSPKGTTGLFVDGSGNVGIGTTGPLVKLHITQASDTNYPTLGTTKGGFLLSGDTNLYGLYSGINTSTGTAWFQAMRNDAATAYNILLNPVGGNVGIGTTGPSYKLHVSGGQFTVSNASVTDRAAELNLTGARTTTGYGLVLANTSTSSTASINKYGLYVDNTATWNGSGAKNYGIYVTGEVDNYLSGNVGIGTTGPQYKLDVVSTSGSPLKLQAGNSGSIEIWKDGTPTKAVGIGLNLPGGTLGDDLAFSTYNGSAWSQRMTILNSNGNVGIGNTTPLEKLDITGNATVSGNLTFSGASSTIANRKMQPIQIGDSQTGNINFYGTSNSLTSGGNLTLAGTISLPNSNTITGVTNYTQVSGGVSVGGGTTYYVNSSGTANLNAITAAGLITANGGVTVASGQNLTVSGNVASHLIPSATNTYDLGSSTKYWNNLYVNNITSSGQYSGFWQRNSGVLSAVNITDDLLIGATATPSSATANHFQILGSGSTSGDASSSGSLVLGTNRTAPTIATRSFKNLTLGDSATGNIVLSPGTGKQVQFFSSSNYVDSSGNLVLAGNLTVPGTTTFNGQAYTWPSSGQSSGYALTTNGSGGLSWAAASGLGTNYWTLANGSLYPVNATVDLLVGGTATTSAKFAFMNVASGTPTASVSGNLTLDAAGVIATTKMQQLTLGSSTTGPIQLSPKGTTGLFVDATGQVGIGTTSPQNKLEVAGSVALAPAYNSMGNGGERYVGVPFSGATWAGAGSYIGFAQGGTGGVSNDIRFYTHKSGISSGERMRIDEAGNVGIGNTSPLEKLDITGNATVSGNLTFSGAASTIANRKMQPLQIGDSATGNINFYGTSNYLTPAGNLTLNGTTVQLSGGSSTLDVYNASADTTLTVSNSSASVANLSVEGQVKPGTYTVNPTATGNGAIIYRSDQTQLYYYNGSAWTAIGSGSGGGSLWRIISGMLTPLNDTLDVGIGGSATGSAKFAFINVNSGTPTATISGNLALAVPTGATPANLLNLYNGGSLNIQTSPGGDAGLTSRLFVDKAGQVGIGNTSPTVKLDITSGNIRLSDTQNIQWGGATNFLTGSNASNYLAFTTNNSERARIDSGGLVGIGTTAPISRLQVTNNPSTLTGKSAVLIDQYENQDLITASASGTTRFYVSNSGDMVAQRFADLANTTYLVDPAATGNAAVNIAGGVTTGTGILTSTVANGATAVGFTLNTSNSLTTQGAKLLSVQTNATEKFYIDKDGNLYTAGTILSGNGSGMLMTNKSGGIVANRSLVVLDTTTNSSFTTTTTAYSKTGFGVVTGVGLGVTNDADGDGVCDANDICMVAVGGEVEVKLTNASTAVKGDYIFTSATAGSGVSSSKQFDGLVGLVSNLAGAGSGYVKMIFKVQPQVTAAASIDKGSKHNEYWLYANNYSAVGEGSDINANLLARGLLFDNLMDTTKTDSANTTVSTPTQFSSIPVGAGLVPARGSTPAAPFRAGLIGGQTLATSTTDNAGNTYLGSNTVNKTFLYDRTRDSSPQVQVELGIDPNWYNGVTLAVATTSAQFSQNTTIVKNPSLSTTYNGSLVKVTGTYSSNAKTIYMTIKSPTTFDWTDYNGQAATGVTMTPGTAQSLGSTGVSATFTNAKYNTGDVFKIASWFVEPASSTRGGTAKFPERSNIIATASSVDIIDADTQKLWMRFSQGTNNLLQDSNIGSYVGISFVNGSLYVGGNGATFGRLFEIYFNKDSAFNVTTSSQSYLSQYNGSIAARNGGNNYIAQVSTSVSIVNATVNDVSAAVICTGNASQPSADTLSGRCLTPQQFVGVATNGGITLINETNGTAVNSSDTGTFTNITMTYNSGRATYNSSMYGAKASSVINVYTNLSGLAASFATTATYTTSVNPAPAATAVAINSLQVVPGTSTTDGTSNTLYVGTAAGASVIQESQAAFTSGSVKYYTKDYISEEMVGDIRGMWPLSANGTLSMSDASVKADTLTNNGTATAVTGVRGSAVSFNGTTQYLSCTDAACGGTSKLDIGTNTYSFGSWIKTSANNGSIISKYNQGVSGSYILCVGNPSPSCNGGANGKIGVTIWDGSGSTSFGSNKTVNDNNWHYIIVVGNSSQVTLYIDGQLDSTGTARTAFDSSIDFYIGATLNSSSVTGYFSGTIDEPFVTATALSASQIKHMYEVGYRALQSHATTLGGGAADTNQQLGFISTGTNTVGDARVDFNNQYLYVGTNSTTLGAVSKIDLNSDTNIKTYNSSANVPTGGPLLIDEDTKSLAVGYNLEAVGSATTGVKTMGVDNNATATSGNFVSKTVTTAESFTQAYIWSQHVTDASDVSNVITVWASNDGGSNYYQCNATTTDTSQTPTEYEYFCQFNAAGSSLKIKEVFARGSTKTNTYLTRYGIAWIGSDALAGAPGGNGLWTNNNSSVANGSYVEVAHNQNSNDLLTNGWINLNGQWKSIDTATESGVISATNASVANGSYVEVVHNQQTNDLNTTGWFNDGSNWIKIDNYDGTAATGGTITYSGGYTIHTFTSSGTFTPTGAGNVEYLVVGGGGGGGGGESTNGAGGGGGGGGAGGFRTGTGFAVTAQAYTITVGSGGTGGASGLPSSSGTNGGDSIFSSITSIGGGGGGKDEVGVGGNGGSGGGGGGDGGSPGSGTSGQGNNGGAIGNRRGSGGGGAGAVGGDASSTGGNGGTGTASSISGTSVTYAGGGGGGGGQGPVAGGSGGSGGGGAGSSALGTGQSGGGTGGSAGTANTGGGGGGTGAGQSPAGGSGGSGIVIVRYITGSLSPFKIVQQDANTVRLYNYSGSTQNLRLDVSTQAFQVKQQDANTVRLYNYSGSTQNLRLDVITGGLGRNSGTVSLAPAAADVDSQASVNSIWINKTGTGGTLLKLQQSGTDVLNLSSTALTLTGNFLPGTDNTYSLGATSSARWKDLFLGPASLHLQAKTTDSGYSGIGQNVDYALGINSTNGAFQVGLNGNSGNVNSLFSLDQSGNASVSGKLTLYNNPVIASTAKQSLTLGDTNTGNIILNGGNVGIGTTGPARLLEVYSTGTAYARITSGAASAGYLEFYQGASNRGNLLANAYGLHSTADFYIDSGGLAVGAGYTAASAPSNGAIIQGNVGIGTTGPTYQLQLSTDSAGKPNGGSWANSSDIRLKTDIANLTGEDALAAITSLRPVSYRWINPDLHGGDSGTRLGFLAQDVQQAFPTWVTAIDAAGADKALVGADGKALSLSLPFDFDAILVQAMKAQQAQIASSNAAIASLSGQLTLANVTISEGLLDFSRTRDTLTSSIRDIGDKTASLSAALAIATDSATINVAGAPVARLTQNGDLKLAGQLTTGAGFDLAEEYPTDDSSITAGDVVALSVIPAQAGIQTGSPIRSGMTLTKTTTPYDGNLLGIVSSQPGMVLGGQPLSGSPARTTVKVALAGRVPVKIDPDSPPIEVGDFLTSSDKPGLAKKATKAGYTVGKALEAWTPLRQGFGGASRIEAFVHLGYYTGELTAEGFLNEDSTKKSALADSLGFGDAISPRPDNLLNHSTPSADLSSPSTDSGLNGRREGDSHSIPPFGETQGLSGLAPTLGVSPPPSSILARATDWLKEHWDSLSKTNTDLIQSLWIKTGILSTDVISPVGSDSKGIAVELGPTQTFGIYNKEGSPSAIFDDKGNASISGTLYADRIVTRFGDLDERINVIASEAKQSLEIATSSSIFVGTPRNDTVLDATSSALLALLSQNTLGPLDQSVPLDSLKVTTNLSVLGSTTLGSTSVAGSLLVDGSLSLSAYGINTIGETLYLQKQKFADLDLMDGALVVNTMGNVMIKGDLTVGGTLFTNTISPIGEGDLVLNLSHETNMTDGPYATPSAGFGRFVIRGADGLAVATIDASGSARFSGDVVASGSGIFSKLVIADALTQAASQSGNTMSLATIGKATLPAGTTEVDVFTTKVSGNSYIYITPISSTDNRVLYLKSKTSGTGFQVAIDQPLPTDVQFNWWVIN